MAGDMVVFGYTQGHMERRSDNQWITDLGQLAEMSSDVGIRYSS